jgi:hypothetical protein
MQVRSRSLRTGWAESCFKAEVNAVGRLPASRAGSRELDYPGSVLQLELHGCPFACRRSLVFLVLKRLHLNAGMTRAFDALTLGIRHRDRIHVDPLTLRADEATVCDGRIFTMP